MRGAIVGLAVLGIVAAGAAVAQEPRPGPAGELLAQATAPHAGQHQGPPTGMPPGRHGMMGQGGQGGMMGQGGMGGMMGDGERGERSGGMMRMHGARGREHLEHLMVHHPKVAARIMRFRADMMKAMSEVLAKHADELEKAP